MADGTAPLTEDERAELEALRKQAAERAQAEQVARERAELERLRSQNSQAKQEAQEMQRIRELKEQRKELVEPDENYKMPPMQKIVLAVLAAIVILFALTNLLG